MVRITQTDTINGLWSKLVFLINWYANYGQTAPRTQVME